MGANLRAFKFCPRQARFIDTPDDARSYYAHKFVGDHHKTVCGVPIVIRFNPEEIHLFTEKIKAGEAWASADLVRRPGPTGEVRRFSRERARLLDEVLRTLSVAVVTHEAKIPGGRLVFGPGDAKALRQGVVIGPGGAGVWFVRTAYSVNAQQYVRALRNGKAGRWP